MNFPEQPAPVKFKTYEHSTSFPPYREYIRTDPTDLNSIYSSPEVIYNPAGPVSYLNPQETTIPNRDFNNQPFMGIQPAINGDLLNTPANNNMTRTSNTTAIAPVRKIHDALIPSSHQEQVDYEESFHFPVEYANDEDYDEEYEADQQANEEAVRFAQAEL